MSKLEELLKEQKEEISKAESRGFEKGQKQTLETISRIFKRESDHCDCDWSNEEQKLFSTLAKRLLTSNWDEVITKKPMQPNENPKCDDYDDEGRCNRCGQFDCYECDWGDDDGDEDES